jgi:hypothetical protein
MQKVTYSHQFNYRPPPCLGQNGQSWTSGLPALEVVLRHGESEYADMALIDTGAIFSVFSLQVAEVPGITMTEGRQERIATLVGAFTAYSHTVELAIANRWSLGQVEVLFAEMDIPRNVLGRSDFLIRVQLGLWEQAGIIYLESCPMIRV